MYTKIIIALFFTFSSVVLAGDITPVIFLRHQQVMTQDSGASQNNLGIISVNFNKSLTSDSCLETNLRVVGVHYHQLGESDFKSESVTAQNLYLDIKCFHEDYLMQLGSMRVESLTPSDVSRLNWLDGMRLKIDFQKYISEFALEIGNIDRDNSGNFYERYREEYLQFIRVKVTKEISDKLKVSLAQTYRDKDIITQVITNYVSTNIDPIIDSMKVYLTLESAEYSDSGFEFSKDFENDLSVDFGYMNVKKDLFFNPDIPDKGRHNFYLNISKLINDNNKFSLVIRHSEIESRYEVNYLRIF